jgi:hypothetical protein
MKRRTTLVIALLYIVTLSLFWWMWPFTRPDRVASLTDSVQGSAKPVAVSASVKKPITLTFVTVSAPEADDATQAPVEVADVAAAAPAPADPPVLRSVIISVPLAQAEHHLFSGSQGPGVANNFSIMGVYDRPASSDKVVDVYMWEDGNGHGGYVMTFLASVLNSDDQAYVSSWEQQQQAAAASNSTPPQLTAATDAFVRYAVELGGGNISDELNQRIANGEYGSGKIFAWLNAVAEAEATPAPQQGSRRVGAGVGPPIIASP